jgi:superfamily I DNA/RNA helicase
MEDFERTKNHQCCIDQDDSVPLVVRLFKDFPQILALYQSRYQYLLVDEFQVKNQNIRKDASKH